MTYIIADACVNWKNLQEADALIEGCAEAGVNAVKFQAYLPDKNMPKELIEITLNQEKIAYLYYRCLHYGVDFICTPMYPEAVDMIAPYVKYFKVRFKDHDNIQILSKIYAHVANKQVLISTDTVGSHPNAYYLFCVPEYPPLSIPSPNSFNGFDGYSCHIPVVNHVVVLNKLHNFKFIEVHAMLDSYDYEPIDQKVSFTIRDLEQLVDRIQYQGGGLLNDKNAWT